MRASCTMLLAGILAARSSPPTTHPFSVHDMVGMDRISDPRVSPDGQSVAFSVRVTDLEANRPAGPLAAPNAGGAPAASPPTRRATRRPAGRPTARASTSSPRAPAPPRPSGCAWTGASRSPSRACPWTWTPWRSRRAGATCSSPWRSSRARRPPRPRRSWPSRQSGRPAAASTIGCSSGTGTPGPTGPAQSLLLREATGKLVDLDATDGRRRASKPFGGSDEYAVSPDGRTVAFAAKDVGGRRPGPRTRTCSRCPSMAEAAPKKLTTNPFGHAAAFSPDGKSSPISP